jgi:hypothetical protein
MTGSVMIASNRVNHYAFNRAVPISVCETSGAIERHRTQLTDEALELQREPDA